MSIDQIFPQIKFAHVNADNIKMPFTQMEGTEAVLGAERQLLSEENRAQRRHFVDVIHDELGKRLLSQNRESLPPSTYKDQYGKKTRISFEPIKGKPKPKLEPMKVPSKVNETLTYSSGFKLFCTLPLIFSCYSRKDFCSTAKKRRRAKC